MTRPLIPIGFGYFAALFVASLLGLPAAPILAVLSFLAAIVLLLLRAHKKYPLALLLAVTFCAAFTVYTLAMRLLVLPAERYNGNRYHAEMEILSEDGKSTGNYLYKAKVRHLEETGQDVDFTVRLSHGEALPVENGDMVIAEVRFYNFEKEPGLSYYTTQLAGGKVLGAYISDYESVTVHPASSRPLAYHLSSVRAAIREKLLENYPKDEAAVLCAMLVGVRDDISDEWIQAYRAAGASHILVISGMHMAILVQFALGAFGFFGVHRRFAAGISVFFVVLFMAVSGMSASVVRSGVMQLLILFGILLGRTPDPINSLSFALLLLSLQNPFCVGDISLLLSFSATLGVLVLTPRMQRFLRDRVKKLRARRILLRAASPVFTALGAVLGSLPVQLYVFGSVNFVSLFTSLLLVYISAFLLRFGILAVIFLVIPGLTPAAMPLVFCSGLLARVQNSIVRWIAAHVPGTIYVGGPYLAPAVLISLLFLFCAVLLSGKKIKPAAIVLALLLFAGSAAINTHLTQIGQRLLVLDTPYASCTAVLEGREAYVLALSGNGNEVEEALRRSGADSVRLLVVKDEEQSVRCAESLAKSFPIGTALVSDKIYFKPVAKEILSYGFGYTGDTALGNISISSGGDLAVLDCIGYRIAAESGSGAVVQQNADILVTTRKESRIRAPMTVYCTEDPPGGEAPGGSGELFITSEQPEILLRLESDGVEAFAG